MHMHYQSNLPNQPIDFKIKLNWIIYHYGWYPQIRWWGILLRNWNITLEVVESVQSSGIIRLQIQKQLESKLRNWTLTKYQKSSITKLLN